MTTHAEFDDGPDAPVSWSDEMTAQEPALLQGAREARHRSLWLSWALWAGLGTLGAHRLYLRRPGFVLAAGPAAVAATVLLLTTGRRRPALLSGLLALGLWASEGARLPRLLREERLRAEHEAMGELDEERVEQEQTRAHEMRQNVPAT